MPDPVSIATVHHEGDGRPTDVARGGPEGYTYWIGATYWTHLRTPWESFATLHYNHRSVDLCLSGNRMIAPVTDNDIKLIQGAMADARHRGYVINSPRVQQHRQVYNTACPGNNTVVPSVWNKIVAACMGGVPIPAPDPNQPTPKKEQGAMDIVRTPSGKGYYIVATDGGVFGYGDAKFFGSMGGKHLNAPIVDMAVRPQGDGYWLVGADGGVFGFGAAKMYGSMAGKEMKAPVVGIECDAEGDGYWLCGQDGGVFGFGTIGFYGSAAGKIPYP